MAPGDVGGDYFGNNSEKYLGKIAPENVIENINKPSNSKKKLTKILNSLKNSLPFKLKEEEKEYNPIEDIDYTKPLILGVVGLATAALIGYGAYKLNQFIDDSLKEVNIIESTQTKETTPTANLENLIITNKETNKKIIWIKGVKYVFTKTDSTSKHDKEVSKNVLCDFYGNKKYSFNEEYKKLCLD